MITKVFTEVLSEFIGAMAPLMIVFIIYFGMKLFFVNQKQTKQ